MKDAPIDEGVCIICGASADTVKMQSKNGHPFWLCRNDTECVYRIKNKNLPTRNEGGSNSGGSNGREG